MLELNETALLLDGLRPPAGMELDAAVGTTFTLDLTALLAIPVSSTLDTEVEARDSADLLEMIRGYADRTILFCQAGAISVPSEYRAALTFVEQSVVEICKPANGIFHPKTWVVRFRGGGRLRHRVLVMSRNLTFDRSWDVVVRLDEDPAAEQAVATEQLETLLSALPGMAARELTSEQAALLSDLLQTLASARLAVPPPFASGRLLAFHDGAQRTPPFLGSCRDALAISPFLTQRAVEDFLQSATRRRTLVSRPAALDVSAQRRAADSRLLKLKELLLDAEDSVDAIDTQPEAAGASGAPAARASLRGLHAKVFVQDDGADSTMWIGSANLTDSFRTNVETLVELSGSARAVGANVVLKSADHHADPNNLSHIVEDHVPVHTDETDEEMSDLEVTLCDLASRSWEMAIRSAGDLWDAHLTVTPADVPGGLALTARLLTLSEEHPLSDGTATWTALSERHLTPFVVIHARGDGAARRVLVRAELDGDPPGRRAAVLAHAISSREDFLRYLAALLGYDLGLFGGAGGEVAGGSWTAASRIDRVLEDLLVTASRSPQRLRTLQQTLTQLRRDEAFAQIVPPDFQSLWDAVYAARKEAL